MLCVVAISYNVNFTCQLCHEFDFVCCHRLIRTTVSLASNVIHESVLARNIITANVVVPGKLTVELSCGSAIGKL